MIASNKIRISIKIIFAMSLFLFLFGSLGFGFKKDLSECSDIPNDDEGKKMDCYHAVAVTQAILYKDKGAAISACEGIYKDIAEPSSKNIKNIGESKRNICLYDVAKAYKDPSTGLTDPGICDGIQETAALSIFTGATATREICKNTAKNLQRVNPQKYFDKEENPNNICALVFIFPLTFIFYYLGSRP